MLAVSPDTGAVPPQFDAFVQSLSVVPVHVRVAAKSGAVNSTQIKSAPATRVQMLFMNAAANGIAYEYADFGKCHSGLRAGSSVDSCDANPCLDVPSKSNKLKSLVLMVK